MINWAELDDRDAERVVADLFAAEFGRHFEVFRTGADGGVDLRAKGPVPALDADADQVVIVQVKHYPGAQPARIVKAFAAEAARGLHTTTGVIYIPVTTADLSKATKDKIAATFPGGSVKAASVWGKLDLERLLVRHESVHAAHYRLWLGSTALLTSVLHHKEMLRRMELLSRLETDKRLLVPTQALVRARETLNKSNAVLLVGPPGVGKSSTAALLLLELLNDGWTPLVAVNSLEDVEALRRTDQKQVVLYDDFLGSSLTTSFIAGKNEDSRLEALLQTASGDDRLKVILTSREYVLRAAQRAHPRLADRIFEFVQANVNANSLWHADRAAILRKQIYFSPGRAALNVGISLERWAKVVAEQRFNPRVIRTALHSTDWDDESLAELPERLLAALADPQEMWRNIWRNQLSQEQRRVILVLATLNTSRVPLDDLAELLSARPAPTGATWRRIVEGLDGDFLSLDQGNFGIEVAFHNPSVFDMAIDTFAGDRELCVEHLGTCKYLAQLEVLAACLGSAGPPRANELAALREAFFRVFPGGQFMRHPSVSSRPLAERLSPRFEHDTGRNLRLLKSTGLERDAEAVSLIFQQLRHRIDGESWDEDALLDAGRALAEAYPIEWRNFAVATTPAILASLMRGYEFVWAVTWLEIAELPMPPMGDRIAGAIRALPSWGFLDRVLTTDRDAVKLVNEFAEAYAACGLEADMALLSWLGQRLTDVLSSTLTKGATEGADGPPAHRPAVAAVEQPDPDPDPDTPLVATMREFA